MIFPNYKEAVQSEAKRLKKDGRILFESPLDLSQSTTTVAPMLNEANAIVDFVSSFRQGNLIIVDNGSTDGSVEMAISTAKQFPEINLVVLHEPNKGIGNARELGCKYLISKVVKSKKLKNHFILNSDTDCIFPKNWRGNYEKAIIQFPETSLLTGTFPLLPPISKFAPRLNRLGNLHNIIYTELSNNFMPLTAGSNFAIGVDTLMKIGGFFQYYNGYGNPQGGEDFCLATRAVLINESIRQINNPIYTDPRKFFYNSIWKMIFRNSNNHKKFRDVRRNRRYSSKDDISFLVYIFFRSRIIEERLSALVRRCILFPLVANSRSILSKNSEYFLKDCRKDIETYVAGKDYINRFNAAHKTGHIDECKNIVKEIFSDVSKLSETYLPIIRKKVETYFYSAIREF